MDRIVVDPAICTGQPLFRGTRITVSVVLRMLGDGHDFAAVIEAYPELSPDDLRAAMRYAAWLASERTMSLTGGA